MHTISALGLVAVGICAGCASPGIEYSRAHPEVSVANRQVMVSRTLPSGTAAAGMTKKQVTLAMGRPAHVRNIRGGESRTDVRDRFINRKPLIASGSQLTAGTDRNRNFTETAVLGPRPSIRERVRVWFRDNQVTYVDVTL